MRRWKRDAQDVVNDLVTLRTSGNGAGFGEMTLSAEGQSLNVNSALLLAASPYLRRTLVQEGSKTCGCGPIVVLVVVVGVTFAALENVVRYVYGEEVTIEGDDECRFLDAAQALEISGMDPSEDEATTTSKVFADEELIKETEVTFNSFEEGTEAKTVEEIEQDSHLVGTVKVDAVIGPTMTSEEAKGRNEQISSKKATTAVGDKGWRRPQTPPKKALLLGSSSKKHARQMTLTSMVNRRQIKDDALVDLTHSEEFNGGIRKAKSTSMLPPPPPPAKRKSDEMDDRVDITSKLLPGAEGDNDFANEDTDVFDPDATMFLSPQTSPMVLPVVSKKNKWENCKQQEKEDSSERDDKEQPEMLKELELSPIVKRKPLSPLNKTENELKMSKNPAGSSHNVKKKLFSKEKQIGVSPTQQCLKDFNKIPERLIEDRGERSRPTKEDKARMDGWSCPECENWYRGLESQMHPREVERLRQLCSKHRQEKDFQPPPATPTDFWNTTMPSTEEAYRTGLLHALPASFEDSFLLKD